MEPRATIAEVLKAGRSVLIACHVEPDGDCLGSGLALYWALDALRIPVVIACHNGVPASLRYLPGADRVVTDVGPDQAFDVAVTLECSSLDRAGRLAEAVRRAETIVAIDHHADLDPYAHLADWDPSTAAVGEQVAELIGRLGVPVDRRIALCLQTAIVTDTGVFRYANTRPATLRLAADLMERGASVVDVVRPVYEEQPASGLRLLGQALGGFTLHHNGAVAVTTITPEMLAAAGASREEVSGIAAALRAIAGVRLAMSFEADEDGVVRVSLRARDGVRADRIARSLGGGGHPAAAGAEIRGRLDEVVRRALALAARELGVGYSGEPATS